MFWNKKKKIESKASKLNGILIESAGTKDIAPKTDYKKISYEGYQSNVYVYRAVKLIADSIADLDYKLYRKVKGELRDITNSPYLDLLNNPNEYQGKGEFMREYFSTLLLSGEGFCEAVFGKSKPQFLYSRRPDRIELNLGDYRQVIDTYTYKVNGREKKVLEKDMSFVKYFNPIDDWRGMSPITAASLSIDINNEYKKWNIGYLINGARPSLAIKMSAETEVTRELKEHFREQFTVQNTGAYNVGKPLLLTGGADVSEVGSQPSDMDGIEGQKLTAKEVGLIYAIDPILMGDTTSTTYNNKSEAKKDFYTDVVFPLMQMWCDELNRWLTPAYGDNLVLSFDRDIDIFAEDIKEMSEIYAKAWENGAITRNEYRVKLNLNELEDGNVYKSKIQDVFVDASMQAEKSIRPKIEGKSIDDIFKNITKSIENILETKQNEDENILKVTESIEPEEIYNDVVATYAVEIAEVGSTALAGLDEGFVFDAFTTNTTKYLEEEIGKKIVTMSETMADKVARIIETGNKNQLGHFDIKENIREMFGSQYQEITDSHLTTIVRTETMDALTFATNEAFIQSEVVDGKEWVTTIDGRERSTHAELDGQIVALNEEFIVPSTQDKSLRPHGFNNADENINCRCVNSAVINNKSIFTSIEQKELYYKAKDTEAESYETVFYTAYKKAFKKQEDNVLKEYENVYE